MNREITSRDEGDAQSSKAAVLRGRKHLIASKAMEQHLGSRAEKVHLPAGLESRGMSQHFIGAERAQRVGGCTSAVLQREPENSQLKQHLLQHSASSAGGKLRHRAKESFLQSWEKKALKLSVGLCSAQVGSHKETLPSNIGLSTCHSLPHCLGGSFATGAAAEPPCIRIYYSSAWKPAPCFLFLAAGRPIHISQC